MTVWLGRPLILAVHDMQIAEHGGGSGVRDLGLLESALARPINLAAYRKPDNAELGAAYAIAIARNHPFVDGNKRTAWAAMVTFFDLNGVEFDPGEVEATATMLLLAAGEIDDASFIAWVRQHAFTP